ncbi:MAG: phosphate acyltransferase PlsX [Desulfovibrio sp.]|nr:phosphate acyltransferase PlsX [Desulfovibrio sp.]
MRAKRERPVIAVDAMGGDHGPSVVVPGALEASRRHDLHTLLVGDRAKIEPVLDDAKVDDAHFDIIHAPETALMNEKPSEILRRKKNSSIQIACRLVKEGEADAVVSAGHSGATVACGMFIMGRLPGVERPALGALLPTEKNPVILIDSGANVDCRPYHLFQFGLMGDAFARDLLGYPSPRVALLSIGEEEGKGNMQVKEAYELLKLAQNLNFIGNAEGRDIFSGDVDVVVCDGFVGNIILKMSEGLAASLMRMIKKVFTSGVIPSLGALLARRAFKNFAATIDYAEYGGAPLLGLQGLAIVCHGRSNEKAMTNAIKMSGAFIRKGANQRMADIILANEELTRYSRSV